MKTLRIYQPYGAHLRFDGVDAVKAVGDFIAFTYQVRNEKGEPTDEKAHGVFCTRTISGYSLEGV